MLGTFVIGFLCLVIVAVSAIMISYCIKIVRRILER